MKPELLIEKDLLSDALLKFQTERIKKYTGTMDVNPKTEEKIQKLINLEKKSYFVLINTLSKRVACVIIATLLAITTTALSVEAIREPLFNFIIETFEKYSAVYFNEPKTPYEDIFLTEYCEPSYIPEGYEKVYEDISPVSYYCDFVKTDEENNYYIQFYQGIINDSPLNINTESVNIEKIYVGEHEAIFYKDKQDYNLVFSDGKYEYTIYVNFNNISKEELTKIAESIEKIN